jgi:hypothetical protein
MDKVVYFLGAGFSAPLGLPVMSNFLIKSKDMYFAAPTGLAHFNEVFEMIKEMSVSKNYFETDLFNIEEILSILEMDRQLQGKSLDESFKRYLHDVVDHFTPGVTRRENLPGNWHRYAFSSELENAYGFFIASLLNLSVNTRERVELETPRPRKIVELACKPVSPSCASYSVVTLNYDCVVEGFTRFYDACADGERPTPLPVLKLHGSIQSGRIIPPTWNKALHPELVEIWKQAFEVLREANHIRIIGYSLPTADSYVKYLLKSAAMQAPHLKSIDVLCLDKTGSVKARYDEFISFYRYRFTRASVVDYLKGLFEDLVKPCEHNFGSPVVCNKLEQYHEQFFGALGRAKGEVYGDEPK